MSVLLIAEHDNSKLKPFTLNAITAASKIDSDVHVLVAGANCEKYFSAFGVKQKNPLLLFKFTGWYGSNVDVGSCAGGLNTQETTFVLG